MNNDFKKAVKTLRRVRDAAALRNPSWPLIDPNTGRTWNDPITFDPIPRQFMAALNGAPYDSRSLAAMMLTGKNYRVPHTRRNMNDDNIQHVLDKTGERYVRIDAAMKRAFIAAMKKIIDDAQIIYDEIPSKNVAIPMLGMRYRKIPNNVTENLKSAIARPEASNAGFFIVKPVRVVPGISMTGSLRVLSKASGNRAIASFDPREFEVTADRFGVVLETTHNHEIAVRRTDKNAADQIDLGILLLTFKKAYFAVTGKNARIVLKNSNNNKNLDDVARMIDGHTFS